MHIFLGILFLVIGPFMTVKSEWMLQNFGRIPWAEEHLGLDGGTRLFYKLLGILLFFLGCVFIFGLFDDLVLFFLSPLFPGVR